MNLTKCSNGHYYDADKFAVCPHCSRDDDDDKTVFLNHTMSMAGTVASESAKTETSSVSLRDAVSVAASSNPNPISRVDNDKTVSYYGGSLGAEPVVGWMVCIEGEMLGKAFELKSGKNFVGRSPSMDIVLEGDPNVSRERHAIITYEPRGRVFIAQPGESRELFYVNDQVVLMNVEVHNRDIFLIGKTKLMFVPLCGKDFAWEDVQERRDGDNSDK